MDTTKATAVLFDFDGVVVDTETQYSHFWHEMGKQYLGMDDIEGRVKGQTLVYIYDTFSGHGEGTGRNYRTAEPL